MADLNIYTRDIDSVVTGFDNHQRVVACQPGFDSDYNKTVLYCRVDRVNSLPDPDIKQILTVARKDQSVKGKFKILDRIEWNNNKNIDYYFERIN